MILGTWAVQVVEVASALLPPQGPEIISDEQAQRILYHGQGWLSLGPGPYGGASSSPK